MNSIPSFPTTLHKATAESARDYFLKFSNVDTVLIVNSCARGKATLESDLDMAILVDSNTTASEIDEMEKGWSKYARSNPIIQEYKQLSQFTHLHLDVIDGQYIPKILDPGDPVDCFEIVVGNQICYSAPFSDEGDFFKELKEKWLPYYDEDLRQQRRLMISEACAYNLDHIPSLTKRGLHFHALDTLIKAFQHYLQLLFIVNKTYPIAYNKWIKDQVVGLLDKPTLYTKLTKVLSVRSIESTDVNESADMLQALLDEIG